MAVSALALLATPAGAAAKPGFSVERPRTRIEFALPATNGYRISVSTAPGESKHSPSVFISASKGTRYTVHYMARGLATTDGTVKTKLPGVGRIAVRFNQLKVTREAAADNCKGRDSVIRHGEFEGMIELHGERGYTAVHSRTAHGEITQSFRQVCDQREPGHAEEGSGSSFRLKTLVAGQEGRRALSFSVSRFDFGPKFGEPVVSFYASSSIHHHGFFVSTSTFADAKAATFVIPDPAGVLENASVSPPAPFHGTADFHLDSPTTSSWTGTLSVELPGLGDVPLAGTGFWSALCEDLTCTKTLPPNVRVAFVSARATPNA